MASSQTSRLGTAPEEGIKAPCVVVSLVNITLSGEQTVNSVAVVAGDRVLVANQTDATENGIYDCSAGTWTRATDWDGANDVVNGQLVTVPGSLYYASYSGAFVVGTTSVSFVELTALAINNTVTYELASSAAAATHSISADGRVLTGFHDSTRTPGSGGEFIYTGVTTLANASIWPHTDGYFYDADGKQFSVINPNVLQFGATGDGATDDSNAFDAALLSAAGGRLYIPNPASSYRVGSLNLAAAGAQIVGESRHLTVLKAVSGLTGFVFGNASAGTGSSGRHRISTLSFDLNGESAVAVDFTNMSNSTIEICHFRGAASLGAAAGTGIKFAAHASLLSGSYSNMAINCSGEYLEYGVLYTEGGNNNTVMGGEFTNCKTGIRTLPLPGESAVDTPKVIGVRIEGCHTGLWEGASYGEYVSNRFEAQTAGTTGTVAGITLSGSNPVSINEATHGRSTGDEVYFNGVGGTTELNNNGYVITVTDANNYTLDGTASDDSGRGTAFTAWTSGGTVRTGEDGAGCEILFTSSSDHPQVLGGFTATTPIATMGENLADSTVVLNSDLAGINIFDDSASRPINIRGRTVVMYPGAPIALPPGGIAANQFSMYFADAPALANGVWLNGFNAAESGVAAVARVTSGDEIEIGGPGVGVHLSPPSETATNLQDSSNAINTSARKVLGYMVWDSTNGRPVWSAGTGDTSVWVDHAGTTVHTPS